MSQIIDISVAGALPAMSESEVFNSPIAYVVLGLFVVFAIIFTARRFRKGGPGPSIGWVPRRLRPGLNKKMEEHGYQKPYDDEGNRNPGRDEY